MAKRKKQQQQLVILSDDEEKEEEEEDDDEHPQEEADDRKTLPEVTKKSVKRRLPPPSHHHHHHHHHHPLPLFNTSHISASKSPQSAEGTEVFPDDLRSKGKTILHGLPKSQKSGSKSRNKSVPFSSLQHLQAKDPLARMGKLDRDRFLKECGGVDALWADKYAPRSLDDLAVNSKKINEVQKWLESCMGKTNGSNSGGRVLLLNGPAGAGKSAVVRVLTRVMGLNLCEWATPAPVLWKEHIHNRTPGAVYMSKLDEFQVFLGTSRKYPLLPLSKYPLHVTSAKDGESGLIDAKLVDTFKVDKVLLIEDLPAVNNRDHAKQLMEALYKLALSAKFPTIIKITEIADRGRKTDQSSKFFSDILHTLESGGARKITFNAITPNAIKRVLRKVVAAENCYVSDESVVKIANNCEGDLRNALLSLQLICLGNTQNCDVSAWQKGLPLCSVRTPLRSGDFGEGSDVELKKHLNIPPGCDEALDEKFSNLNVGRDVTLSLFHALGKLLHNKRLDNEDALIGSSCDQKLLERHRRPTLNMAEPEVILSQAQLEVDAVMAFLHENVLQFVDEEASDNVAEVASYLSDADAIGTKRKWHLRSLEYLHNANDADPSQLAEAVASSVAARGILFANAHNPSRKWQSLRAPLLWQIDHLIEKKEVELRSQGFAAGMSGNMMLTTSTHAIEYGPFRQKITSEQSKNLSQFACSSHQLNLVNDNCQDHDVVGPSTKPELGGDVWTDKGYVDISQVLDGDDIEEW